MVARDGSPEDIGSSMLGSYPTAQATVEDSAGECEKYWKPASEGTRKWMSLLYTNEPVKPLTR